MRNKPKQKHEFVLKAGTYRRYILHDGYQEYTSILHFCKVAGISEYYIRKRIRSFLDQGYSMNLKPQVTTTLHMKDGRKVKITILNYEEDIKKVKK